MKSLTVALASVALAGFVVLVGCQSPTNNKGPTSTSSTTVAAQVADRPQDATLLGTYDNWVHSSATGWLKVPNQQLILGSESLTLAGTTIFPAAGLTDQKLGFKDGQISLAGRASGTTTTVYVYDYYLQSSALYGAPVLWLKVETTPSATLTVAPNPANALQSQILCYVPVGKAPVDPIHVDGVSLTPTVVVIKVGGTAQLTAALSPTGANDKNVAWTSSDPSLVSVTGAGLVGGLSLGSATVTVQTEDGGKTANCSVNVGVLATNLAGSKDTAGTQDGTGSGARFSLPTRAVNDGSGNLYVLDLYRIRKVTPQGVVTAFAGSGSLGSTDGQGTSAAFMGLTDLTIDHLGNLFIADYGNSSIRKVTPSGSVSTLATNVKAKGLAVDSSGNLYAADDIARVVRKIATDGTVTVLAGSGTSATVDGIGTNASFAYPEYICVDGQGNVFVADMFTIRKITSQGTVTTVADLNGMAGMPPGNLCNDLSGNLFFGMGYYTYKLSPIGVLSTIPMIENATSGSGYELFYPGAIGFNSAASKLILGCGYSIMTTE